MNIRGIIGYFDEIFKFDKINGEIWILSENFLTSSRLMSLFNRNLSIEEDFFSYSFMRLDIYIYKRYELSCIEFVLLFSTFGDNGFDDGTVDKAVHLWVDKFSIISIFM